MMNKRTFKTFTCGECKNKFKPENEGIWYVETKDNLAVQSTIKEPIKWICPDCIKKWEESFKTKTMEYMGNGYVYVEFANGSTQTIKFETFTGRVTIDYMDVPQFFLQEIQVALDEYRKEKQSQEIVEFELVDEFDKQYIYLKAANDYENTLKFRYGRTGEFIFEKPPQDVFPLYILKQFNSKLREKLSRG